MLLGTAALVASAGASSGFAQATLRDGTGATVGTVRLSVMSRGKVMVKASVWGLPPGFHGFHVHAVGVCDPATGFASAGGHFNPAGAGHPGHAGDQPVLLVNADGTGTATFVTDRYAIIDLFDADGSAFIVHALADNYANIPTRYASEPDAATLGTGDAGGRLACGVIGLTP